MTAVAVGLAAIASLLSAGAQSDAGRPIGGAAVRVNNESDAMRQRADQGQMAAVSLQYGLVGNRSRELMGSASVNRAMRSSRRYRFMVRGGLSVVRNAAVHVVGRD